MVARAHIVLMRTNVIHLCINSLEFSFITDMYIGRCYSLYLDMFRREQETRTIKYKGQQENLKSAITDHCKRENHWDNARVINARVIARVIKQENNQYHRWMKEAIEVRKRSPKTMNRDEGDALPYLEWRPGGEAD